MDLYVMYFQKRRSSPLGSTLGRYIKMNIAMVAFLCAYPLLHATGVQVWLEPTSCKPGDLVTLHAQLESSEFAEFSLKFNSHKALHFVSQQKLPVSYDGQIYRQKSIWLMQTMDSGLIELTDIKASIQRGAIRHEQTIAPQTINVVGYAAAKDPSTPLPLPPRASEDNNEPTLALWIAGMALLAFGIYLYFARKNRNKPDNTSRASAPTLANLISALEAGEWSPKLIESILSNPKVALTQETQSALEDVLYSKRKNADANTLLTIIRKEPRA